MISAGKRWPSSQKPPEQIKMRGRDSSHQAGGSCSAAAKTEQKGSSPLPTAPLLFLKPSPPPPPSPLTSQKAALHCLTPICTDTPLEAG